MAASEYNSDLSHLFEETEGNTINTTCTLSATRENEPFWGIKLKLPTAKVNENGEIIILVTKEEFCKKFKEYLLIISKPFPILIERIKYFNFNFCGTDSEWEQAIIMQQIDDKNEIYLCDHCHCH